MSQSLSNNINSFNVSNNLTLADDRSNILTWLSPLDPKLRHQDIRERRVENIGEWLLQTEEFRDWYTGSEEGESSNRLLFCYGDPGVGKTYISSLVIDSLCDGARGQNASVACFYFDFAAQKEQSSASVLRALLKQLVGGLEDLPEEISQAYQDQKNSVGGREPGPSDTLKMLRTTSFKKRTFICMDALDECAAEHRVKILDSLNKVLQNCPDARIFATGRPHVRPEIGRRLAWRLTCLSVSPKRADIIMYLHSRLNEDTNLDAMDSSLEADILRKIPEDISEIFLLVSLNIDAILQETTIHRRRQKLSSMTDGLGLEEVYGATLGRIKGQGGEKSRLGMAALMWISHSERPLKSDELCHALAVEIGSPDLNPNNIPSVGTMLACCQGLTAADKEASTVRPIHSTLQEYLRARPEFFGTAYSAMAETCLSHLNSRQIKALPSSPSPNLEYTPFLEYSSLFWGVYAKRDPSDRVKLLALKLFDDYDSHISTKILLKAHEQYAYGLDFTKSLAFSALHCASLFGINEIVADLVEVEGCDINKKDCTGNTPLVWAARNGHQETVKMLLAQDNVDPDKLNKYGSTPLCCAAQNGYEGIVNMLLARDDVDPNKPSSYGSTPLYCAAENRYTEIVKILLARDNVDPDKPNNDCWTPLHRAALDGHEGTVKILLTRDDSDPEKPDNDDRTPLHFAAMNGHEAILKILLARDNVDPDEPDTNGRTPLHCAAMGGYRGIVKILLARDDVDPNKSSNHGWTPLHYAAVNGHEGILKILLARDDVDPDKPNKNGLTPLYYAILHGHGRIVRILLARDNPDPDKPDKNGRTPL